MKKTNVNESVKRFKEKIKTDKKFRTQFATTVVASVVVIATAITAPVVIHNNKIKAEEYTSVPIVSEVETETITEIETEPETETTEPETTEPITAEATEPSKPVANKPQSNKNNGSGNKNNSGNKGNAGNNAGNTVTQNPNSRLWTEQDTIDAVEEAKRYAISKGFVIDPSLNKDNSSWGPQLAAWHDITPERKAKLSKDLRDRVDSTYQRIRNCFPEYSDEEYSEIRKEHPATINIFYEARPFDNEEPWFIYVVF